ncbi:hypothetical protein CARUB_v10006149mg [Capsella rubella]|uniref:Peptidase A1 domain-containing protein n=1 Tax=Capsella rubella TaxID=81985 RepID=R0F815_9BRAS|nr:hypothetical protein CARUB_v10006149mg [Capsella rubella]
MMNRDLLYANLFSLWMRDYEYAGDDRGEIMFGAMSVNHYNTAVGHVHYDVVEYCHEWMIHMSFVSVGQNQVHPQGVSRNIH